MAEPPLPPICSPSWSTSDWMSTGVLPLSGSPKIWSVSSGESSENNHTMSTPAELVANLVLPPPMTPSLPFLYSGDMILDDITVSTPIPSPSVTQPFFTLPATKASKCAFPPSCPVLVCKMDGSSPEVGLVQLVVADLNGHPMRSHKQVFYDISVALGTKTLHRMPESALQFAPQCPVWFQTLHDTESQHPGTVLASYHAPHLKDSSDVFYSVRVDSPVPLVHHGVCLHQLSFRPSQIVSSSHSPIITSKRDLNRPTLLQRLERSVPAEVLTSNASMHSVSTRSLTDPSCFLDPSSPVGVISTGNKYSVKFHIPSWIADTTDLENNLLKPNTKYRARVEHKTGCTFETEQSLQDGSPASWTVTMYNDDSNRLASSRTYVENFIIDRVHERLEGRLLYHFALDQTGQAFEPDFKVVENRKVEVFMTAIALPSETCVKAVIGKGGRFINFVRSMTGCTVTLESRSEITTEPYVHIFAEERDKVEEAATMIEEKILERS